MSDSWVVGDLGGTNARFALANSRTRSLDDPLTMPTHSASTLVALVGDFLDKPLAKGGLDLSRPLASLVLAAAIVMIVAFTRQRRNGRFAR